MKLLFDQNIWPGILKQLTEEFSESQQVRFIGLENGSDSEISNLIVKNILAINEYLQSGTDDILELIRS